jgi:hypothetical protein
MAPNPFDVTDSLRDGFAPNISNFTHSDRANRQPVKFASFVGSGIPAANGGCDDLKEPRAPARLFPKRAARGAYDLGNVL